MEGVVHSSPMNCDQKPRNDTSPMMQPAFTSLRSRCPRICGHNMRASTTVAPRKRNAVNHVAPTRVMAPFPMENPRPQIAAASTSSARYTHRGSVFDCVFMSSIIPIASNGNRKRAETCALAAVSRDCVPSAQHPRRYLPLTMESEIFPRALSTPVTHTVTLSPTDTTSLGCRTKRSAILEM